MKKPEFEQISPTEFEEIADDNAAFALFIATIAVIGVLFAIALALL
jgi:hypothetical protein